jgi:hypothetical protein
VYPTVGALYFDPFNPYYYFPYSFISHLPLYSIFQYTSLYPQPSKMLCFILLMLYHSLFLFLLFTNMFVMIIFDCVYVYLLDLSSTCERKHVVFVFLNLATSLNMMSSNCIHLPSNHMVSLVLAAVECTVKQNLVCLFEKCLFFYTYSYKLFC